MSCSRWTMGRLGCREDVGLSKDVRRRVRGKGATNPSDSIAIPSQVPICVQNHLKPDAPSRHSLSLPLSPLPNPRTRSSTFHRPMAYRRHLSLYRFERREGRPTLRTSGIRLHRTGFSHIVRAFIVDQIPGEKRLWIRTCTRRQR